MRSTPFARSLAAAAAVLLLGVADPPRGRRPRPAGQLSASTPPAPRPTTGLPGGDRRARRPNVLRRQHDRRDGLPRHASAPPPRRRFCSGGIRTAGQSAVGMKVQDGRTLFVAGGATGRVLRLRRAETRELTGSCAGGGADRRARPSSTTSRSDPRGDMYVTDSLRPVALSDRCPPDCAAPRAWRYLPTFLDFTGTAPAIQNDRVQPQRDRLVVARPVRGGRAVEHRPPVPASALHDRSASPRSTSAARPLAGDGLVLNRSPPCTPSSDRDPGRATW